jgi:hypothetical protein
MCTAGIWAALPVLAGAQADAALAREKVLAGLRLEYRIVITHFDRDGKPLGKSKPHSFVVSTTADGWHVKGHVAAVKHDNSFSYRKIEFSVVGSDVIGVQWNRFVGNDLTPRFHVAEVTHEPGEAAKYSVAFIAVTYFRPFHLNPLIGKSLFGLEGLTPEVRRAPDGGTRLTYRSHNGAKPLTREFSNEVRFEYWLAADGALIRSEAFEFERPMNSMKVSAYRSVRGEQLPEQCEISHTQFFRKKPYVARKEEFELVSVIDAPEAPPIGIPIGGDVFDFRLQGVGFSSKDWPIRDPKPVQYEWTGRLPTLDELKRMQRPVSKPPEWLPALIPAGMIVLGVGLIWRAQRTSP